MAALAETLLEWYDRNKRVLPFRGTDDPYKIWLSEIMLQQTRTETVGAYYERFLSAYPTVEALSRAQEGDVLKAWEGLGYYSRARNLLKCARAVMRDYDGRFPRDAKTLEKLPGVGPYTAAAVASIAFDQRVPAMDGNLTRVISRVYGMREDAASPSGKRALYTLAQDAMPKTRSGAFNQALMDIGATICTPGTPSCALCPLSPYCAAYRDGDAEALPVLPLKKPQKVVPLSVLLVTRGDAVYLEKRDEKLLNGLYVFLLCNPGEEEKALKKRGIAARPCGVLGTARHVFTHLIWEMTILRYRAESAVPSARFYTLEEAALLPIPTAMRAAVLHIRRALQCPELDILPVTPQNLADAGRVYGASWRGAHEKIVTKELMARHTDDYHASLLLARQKTGYEVFLGILSGVPAGVVAYQPETGEVATLYIAPEYQGLGVGRALLSFALPKMRRGVTPWATVLGCNAHARAFYTHFGFAETDRRRILDEKTGLSESDFALAEKQRGD